MQQSKKIKSRVNKKVFSLSLYIIAVVFLSYICINMIFNKDPDKGIFGYTARLVISSSMAPDIAVNSINIIDKCEIDDISAGDVICFSYNNNDIVHRVIEVISSNGETVIHTKGDANEVPDSIEVTSDMIVGKIVCTLNSFSYIIDKYSIEPGKIDSALLARNIILGAVLLGIVVALVSWLVYIARVILVSFSKNDNFDKQIDKYINDINELMIYRDLLIELNERKVDNKPLTRFEFIFNRLARAKAIMECKSLHSNVKEFKKSIKRCYFMNSFGNALDHEEKESSGTKTLHEIIEYMKEFEENSKSK